MRQDHFHGRHRVRAIAASVPSSEPATALLVRLFLVATACAGALQVGWLLHGSL